MINARTFLAVALVLSLPKLSAAADAKRGSVSGLFSPSNESIVVVAHRGCHDPAPKHGFGYAPENSLLALERCVTMGADMMETDVHMTADGYLVMIHDDTVERTTDGHGVISTMTLAEVRKLRLRQNLGGYAEPLTDEHVPTLDEMLKAAKGRITLNLDVKAPIYAEVVDAVLRAGATDLVTVKTRAGIASPALAAIAPFNKVLFVPVLNAKGSDLVAVAERQATGAKPVAFELPNMLSTDVPKIVAVERQHGIKLFSNTLGDGFCIGIGGDNDALKDPDAVWGWLYRNGISIFQTDRPEALLEFRSSQHK
ncbi:glycerophosphodiester phosphodiesterase family protein [Granulicella sp. L60]|uniref:glycerophosphodiester phosphodiesterase family protein n=1 Tax=Granulicella sp. L60 TaxID=1641866 RepID=UPI001576047A|nr:glycerophosphodiester phosphodiesterase family protein [Granulicella sp. L60]